MQGFLILVWRLWTYNTCIILFGFFLPQVLELTSSALFNQDNSAMRKLSCLGNLHCRSLCCNIHVKETDTVTVNADKKTQTRLFIIKLLYNRQTSDKQIFSNFICITATGCLNEMWVNEGTLCFLQRQNTHHQTSITTTRLLARMSCLKTL